MVIEAWINGDRLTTREIPEERLQDLPGAGWEQNVRFRETLIGLEIDKLRDDMKKIFHRVAQVQYYLVFPSKMNADETEKS